MVEHAAVNRRVVGSSPTRGAKPRLFVGASRFKVGVGMFYVYTLYSSKFNKIYVGQTIDLEKRLNEHNSGLSNYTKRFMPWKIIYTEKFETRTEAIKREKQLKSQKGREFVWKHIGKEFTAGL